jgi:hypothetical protein
MSAVTWDAASWQSAASQTPNGLAGRGTPAKGSTSPSGQIAAGKRPDVPTKVRPETEEGTL